MILDLETATQMGVKPCPFCGRSDFHLGPTGPGHRIRCLSCRATIEIVCPSEFPRGITMETIDNWLQKEVLQRWNLRKQL